VRKADVALVGASLPCLFICNALNWIEGWVYFDWKDQIWANSSVHEDFASGDEATVVPAFANTTSIFPFSCLTWL